MSLIKSNSFLSIHLDRQKLILFNDSKNPFVLFIATIAMIMMSCAVAAQPYYCSKSGIYFCAGGSTCGNSRYVAIDAASFCASSSEEELEKYTRSGDYWQVPEGWVDNGWANYSCRSTDRFAPIEVCGWSHSKTYVATGRSDSYGKCLEEYRCSACPLGSVYEKGLVCTEKFVATPNQGEPPCNTESNPCDVITGRKIQTEQDIQNNPINLSRYYDSGSAHISSWIGVRWRHNFDTSMDKLWLGPDQDVESLPAAHDIRFPGAARSNEYDSPEDACQKGWNDIKTNSYRGLLADAYGSFDRDSGECQLKLGSRGTIVGSITITHSMSYIAGSVADRLVSKTITRPSGAYYSFKNNSEGIYEELNGYDVRLEQDGDDWLFYDTDNTIDRFRDRRLIERTLPNKKVLNLKYSAAGYLDTVTDEFGHNLQFAYDDNGQISSITYPNGKIEYSYDTRFNLIAVTYEDNSVRQYHYEDSRHTHHLTGITDERGIRYSSWTYDDEGKALSSFHAGDIDKTTFEYTDTSTIVTDPMGATREYHLGMRNNELVVTSVTGDRCMDCWKGGAAEREYDDNGHISQETDWEGNVTTYIHNDRGQEVSRTEAFGTPQARTITTEWHAEFNLPIRITESQRVMIMAYDVRGRLLSREIRQRNDL